MREVIPDADGLPAHGFVHAEVFMQIIYRVGLYLKGEAHHEAEWAFTHEEDARKAEEDLRKIISVDGLTDKYEVYPYGEVVATHFNRKEFETSALRVMV